MNQDRINHLSGKLKQFLGVGKVVILNRHKGLFVEVTGKEGRRRGVWVSDLRVRDFDKKNRFDDVSILNVLVEELNRNVPEKTS